MNAEAVQEKLARYLYETDWAAQRTARPGFSDEYTGDKYRRKADGILRTLDIPAIEREAKAAAWDEGFDAGHQAARAVNPEWPEQPTNPYQEANQ